MKKWLTQFQSPNALERALHAGPPPIEPPPGLHGRIMAAIQTSEPIPVQSAVRGYAWPVAGGSALLVIAALWGANHLLVSRLTLSPFSFSPKLNQQVAALPGAALSPLSSEWQSLNLDLERTADFLLSSIP